MPEVLRAPPTAGASPRPFWRWWWSRRVEVRDESMRPTLQPGDHLRVDRRAYRDRLPIPGELVVLVDPGAPDRWLVKRVASIEPGPPGAAEGSRPTARPGQRPTGEPHVSVLGDAPEHARDSRTFGPVPLSSLVGRVYRCYAPPERRREF
jgi:hypothetical protein